MEHTPLVTSNVASLSCLDNLYTASKLVLVCHHKFETTSLSPGGILVCGMVFYRGDRGGGRRGSAAPVHGCTQHGVSVHMRAERVVSVGVRWGRGGEGRGTQGSQQLHAHWLFCALSSSQWGSR